MTTTKLSMVQTINNELARQTNDPATMKALMSTTFKKFQNEQLVKQACLEAMMNGYTFQDLVQKKVYAIPYGNGYSLVESISNIRAKAMKSGQIGKSAPVFEDKDGKIISCTVTVQKALGNHIGDFTATVYFDEYTTNKNNWATKPRTMIAKVAEMHALRMAFPEELKNIYTEEEFHKEKEVNDKKEVNNINKRLEKLTPPKKMGEVEKKEEIEELEYVDDPTVDDINQIMENQNETTKNIKKNQ